MKATTDSIALGAVFAVLSGVAAAHGGVWSDTQGYYDPAPPVLLAATNRPAACRILLFVS
jgi:hypothetical protein